MGNDIKDTKLYRIDLENKILRELCRKWVRLAGKAEIATVNPEELVKEWVVPENIMGRVIQEMIDDGSLEYLATDVTLTAKGRAECEKRKFDE